MMMMMMMMLLTCTGGEAGGDIKKPTDFDKFSKEEIEARHRLQGMYVCLSIK